MYLHFFFKVFDVLVTRKSQFLENIEYFHWERSISCTTKEYDNATTPYYPIFFLSVKWSLKNSALQRQG